MHLIIVLHRYPSVRPTLLQRTLWISPQMTLYNSPKTYTSPKTSTQLHPGLSPRFHFTPLLRCAPEFYLDCPRVHPTPPLRLYTRLLPRLQPRFQPTPLLKFHPKLLPGCTQTFPSLRPLLKLHLKLLPRLHIAALTRLHLRLFMLDFTSGIPKGPELLEWSD